MAIEDEELNGRVEVFKQEYLVSFGGGYGIFPILFDMEEEDFNWVRPPLTVARSNKYLVDCFLGTLVFLAGSAILNLVLCIFLHEYLTLRLNPDSNTLLYLFRFRLNNYWVE